MKRLFVIMLTIIMIAGVTLSVASIDSNESVEVYRNYVKLEVNGNRVPVDNFLYNGITYIPIRAVSELLNKQIGWNSYTQVASINDNVYQLEQLAALLPKSSGFVWNYDGFAEYSHQMTIYNIIDESLKREYMINGEVGDSSGGESSLDRSISMKYTIMDNKLVQEKIETVMLDSKFNKMTLIQTPLEAGTFWAEDLEDKNGDVTTINALIKKVEVMEDGSKQYTVRYDDINSSYYEERVIREGMGIVNFEKLLVLQDSSFPVSYFLFNSNLVKETQLKLYFPDTNAEKLHLEFRNESVVNNGVAKAAIEALILGPSTNLTHSIPTGTKLLNIYIVEDICYVDFSREFIINHSGGSAGELMTLYSIVNTLTEFNTIKGVQILIEGKSGETLGNILLDEPIQRRQDLIGI